jgi:photosystem II stability/assembly factor-like uncharacterized protein
MAGTDDVGLDSVRRSENAGDSWSDAKKEPTGDPTTQPVYVLVADDVADTDMAYIALGGADGGFSIQVDDRIWNTIGLIDTDITYIQDLSFADGESVIFMATYDDDSGTDAVWRYASDWERVFSETLAEAVLESTHVMASQFFSDDDMVFIHEDGDDEIMFSDDGGNLWEETVREAPAPITGWIVIDDETIIVGDGDDSYKTTNTGRSWGSADDMTGGSGRTAFVLARGFYDDGAEDEEHMLAGTENGLVFRSTNAGDTWSELETSNMTGMCVPTFDAEYADNETMYCSDSDGGVYRYVEDVSTNWKRIDALSGAPTIDDAKVEMGTGCMTASDGTLYATDSQRDGEGISRSLNPTADKPFFEPADQDEEGTLQETLYGLWKTEGSNKLWSIYYDSGEDQDHLYYFIDTLTGKVNLTSPTDGKSSMRTDSVVFSWTDIAGAEEYEIEVNSQEDFNGADLLEADEIEGTTYTWVSIPDAWTGVPLYWRVRVFEQEPLRSNWSDKWHFSTQLAEGQWNPFVGGVPEAPYNGATGVALSPTFAWNAADWATGYEFELADNANFTSPIAKKTVTVTVWVSDTELEYGKTYYWRVRAVNASTQSEWGTGVFTTMQAPAPPPPPPPPAPTPPAPIMPAPPIPTSLLWAIIGIGAALAIGVIVLIIRTRRAV